MMINPDIDQVTVRLSKNAIPEDPVCPYRRLLRPTVGVDYQKR